MGFHHSLHEGMALATEIVMAVAPILGTFTAPRDMVMEATAIGAPIVVIGVDTVVDTVVLVGLVTMEVVPVVLAAPHKLPRQVAATN